MNSGDKLKATFIIWAAFVLACLFTFANKTTIEVGHVFIGLFFVIAALAAGVGSRRSTCRALEPSKAPT